MIIITTRLKKAFLPTNKPKRMNRAEKNKLAPDLYSRNTVIAFLADKIVDKEQPKVLDVGGYGAKLSWFLPEDTNFTIMDSKTPPEKLDNNVVYKQGNAQKIPFSDRNFELVVCTDMLEHVDKPFRAPIIRELIRVSKNHLILGVPCGNGLIGRAEEKVLEQFRITTGTDHPFLKEHRAFGLPDEAKIDEILSKEGVSYFKVKEGNLMNWYIQQLYTSVINEHQAIRPNAFDFYRYFNDNLFELGNLRTPVYRTIYCISKEDTLPAGQIIDELQEIHQWRPEVFMELLQRGFNDMHKVINEKNKRLFNLQTSHENKINHIMVLEQNLLRLRHDFEETEARRERTNEQLNEYSLQLAKQNETIEKAKNSINEYRNAIEEVRSFLQEKEKALRMMKNMILQKDILNERLKNEKNLIKEILNRNILELEKANKENEWLKHHIDRNEDVITSARNEITTQKQLLHDITLDLENHRKALQGVLNSKAWKAVMVYSKLKSGVIITPAKAVMKGCNILTKLGPREFVKRSYRKLKKSQPLQVAGGAYAVHVQKTQPTITEKKSAQKIITDFHYRPVISIITPVYNIDEKWLVSAIESVLKQWYPRWELCICDDASSNPRVKEILHKYAHEDSRIKIHYRQKNGGIVKASNDALKMATGAYVTFLDHDDELTEDALFEVVKEIQESRYDLIYSDEDKISPEGELCDPFFKPDWSPDLLLSNNYICHLAVYRRKILNEIGGLRDGFDGCQDYDLVLRFTEKTLSIKHIPKVLYHWRKITGSTSADITAKPYVFENTKKALSQAMKRRNITGNVTDGRWPGSYRVIREIKDRPMVSVIIPFRDKPNILRACLESIITRTTWSNYEIILVNNNSELIETENYLRTLSNNPNITIITHDKPFNYSEINNEATKRAKGDILLLLNNDTQVITPEWIEVMLEHALRPEVGAVGPKLLFTNDLVQHAGIQVGVGGIANNSFTKIMKEDHGYFGLADVIRNVSAVTGACLMIRKDLYEKFNGLNSENLAVAFNDVDFCLRLREKGYINIYTPFAELYHHESLTRGYEVSLDEVQFMQRQHRSILKNGDPYYNPNLTRERLDYSLRVEDKIS